jgi:hypothetical protein
MGNSFRRSRSAPGYGARLSAFTGYLRLLPDRTSVYDFRRVVRRAAPLTRLPFLPTTKDRFPSIPNELPVP